MNIFSKNTKCFGLCITPQYLALAMLAKQGQRETIGYFEETSILSSNHEEILEKVKENYRDLVDRYSPLFISVPAIKVLRKVVHLSKELSMADITLHFKIEKDRYFPEIQESLSFDFFVSYDKESDKNSDEHEVHLFAIKTEEVVLRKKIAKALNLNLQAIEPDNLAAVRLVLLRNSFSDIGGPFAFLTKDIDKNWHFLIFNNQEIIYEQVLIAQDFNVRFLQAIRNFKVAMPQVAIEKFLVPSHYQEDFLFLGGSQEDLPKVEYLNFVKAGEWNIPELHYLAQVAVGLAWRELK